MKQFMLSLLALSLLTIACSDKKKTTDTGDKKDPSIMAPVSNTERNKKVIMASMEAFNNNNMDMVFKDAAPGFTDYTDGSMPPINNLDSLKTFFKAMKQSIPDYKGENFMYLADGDKVAAVGDWSGTFKTDLMGMKATGKKFTYKDVDIFTFNEEGKITEHHSIQNFGAVLMGSGAAK
jgi:predicted ester cyclase